MQRERKSRGSWLSQVQLENAIKTACLCLLMTSSEVANEASSVCTVDSVYKANEHEFLDDVQIAVCRRVQDSVQTRAAKKKHH